MKTLTHINTGTSAREVFSDDFIDYYVVWGDVVDENGNQVEVIDLSKIDTEAVDKDKFLPLLPPDN